MQTEAELAKEEAVKLRTKLKDLKNIQDVVNGRYAYTFDMLFQLLYILWLSNCVNTSFNHAQSHSVLISLISPITEQDNTRFLLFYVLSA